MFTVSYHLTNTLICCVSTKLAFTSCHESWVHICGGWLLCRCFCLGGSACFRTLLICSSMRLGWVSFEQHSSGRIENLSKQKYHSLMYRLNDLGLYKLGLVNVNVIFCMLFFGASFFMSWSYHYKNVGVLIAIGWLDVPLQLGQSKVWIQPLLRWFVDD